MSFWRRWKKGWTVWKADWKNRCKKKKRRRKRYEKGNSDRIIRDSGTVVHEC